MKTGRACVLVQPGQVETWEVPVPEPEPGGALVRIVFGGVCGSDVHLLTGEAGVIPFPIILGHEGVGRIEKLSPETTTDYAGVAVKPGDLVYWAPIALCHRCYSCSVLDQTPCENSQFFEHADKPNWGSYADYAWLPNGLAFFRLPDGADPLALAALGCGLPTALRGFDRLGAVRIPETLSRIAPGIVWVCALLAALLPLERLFGADFEDGSLDQLLVTRMPASAIALAKAVAHWLVTGLPLLAAAGPLAIMLQIKPPALPVLLVGLLAGTMSLSLLGTACAAIVLGARRGAVLLAGPGAAFIRARPDFRHRRGRCGRHGSVGQAAFAAAHGAACGKLVALSAGGRGRPEGRGRLTRPQAAPQNDHSFYAIWSCLAATITESRAIGR